MEKELELFLESCKSEETKKQYSTYLKKWINFTGGLSFDNQHRKVVEDKIIQYIVDLKKQGKSKAAIHNYVEPVCSLYSINDVILNRKKINKFVPESRKMRSDKSYIREQISKLLEIADERMRVIILLLASSGIRIGAVPSIRLNQLQDKKLTIYENTNEEYFTFVSTECRNAIDFYLNMRSRYGEELTDESLLIREQFDVRFPAPPRQISKTAIQLKLYDLCHRCAIDKRNIAIGHGFRKFFTTQLVSSRVNPEIREMLLGHKIGLASAYYRPTGEEMYQEYERAVNSLTINEEYRLKIENSRLQEKNNDNEYIIRGKLEEKDKQIQVLMKKQEKFDILIQSLIDSGQLVAS